MKKSILLPLLLLSLAIGACQKEDKLVDESVVRLEPQHLNALDRYIEERISKPYSVQIIYRMRDVEYPHIYTLTPPRTEQVAKLVNAFKYLFYEPYEKVLGHRFASTLTPPVILFSSTPAYSASSHVTNGLATGGVHIAMLGIDAYDLDNLGDAQNLAIIKEGLLRVLYHESTHILNQRIRFPIEFEKITPAYKEGDSFAYWERNGKSVYKDGFISDYASTSASEDFAEMVGRYVIDSEEEWNDVITSTSKANGKNDGSATYTGAELLTKKIEIVKNYLKKEWGYDIDALRSEVQVRLAQLKDQDLSNISLD